MMEDILFRKFDLTERPEPVNLQDVRSTVDQEVEEIVDAWNLLTGLLVEAEAVYKQLQSKKISSTVRFRLPLKLQAHLSRFSTLSRFADFIDLLSSYWRQEGGPRGLYVN